jgi:very-short-patch-repair endonuclease
MNLPKNINLKFNSQNLRKNMTKEERHLWHDFLKTYAVQFNRQKVIGNYIIDFYCDKAKLVIEIDGSQHYEDSEISYDKERTEYLNQLGLKVLRFTNIDINKNFNGVCETIDIIVKESVN